MARRTRLDISAGAVKTDCYEALLWGSGAAYSAAVRRKPRWVSPTAAAIAVAVALAGASIGGSALAFTETRPAGLIGFGRYTAANRALLEVVTTDGHVRSVASGAITDFSWSPDGSRIVFARSCCSSGRRNYEDLLVAKDFGPGPVSVITNNAGTTVRDFQPVWSPDRAQIAFVRVVDHVESIYVTRPDGKHLKRLTTPPKVNGVQTRDFLPQWSPDATKVAFMRDRSGVRNLFVIDRDGTHEVPLTNGGFEGLGFSWAPAGERLAFVEGDNTAGDLFTIQSDGSDKKQLTSDGHPKFQPVWSPDGKQIVYAQGVSPEFDLFVVPTKRDDPRRVTDSPGREISPSWSRDSRFVAYESFAPGFTDTAHPMQEPGKLNIVSIRTRTITTLASGKIFVFPIAWQPAGDPSARGFQRK